jgi:RNA polymerase sigma factor (sigma-70 family)
MSLPDNSEIRKIFLENHKSSTNLWMENLFILLRPLVISRIKKFKKFLYFEDMEQEFSIALWTAIKTFDCQRHFDFYRWANWYFISASRDFQKKYRPLKSINLGDSDVKGQYDIVLANEVLGCKGLTSTEKDIVIMTLLEDMSLTDAGIKLNLSTERIRVLQKRAIFKMREYGEQNGFK